MVRTARAALVEYSLSLPPNAILFDLNPESVTRTRTVMVNQSQGTGNPGGYDFVSPTETDRASQGVTAQPESISVEVLLDATERMEHGDAIATTLGVEPELAMLRTLCEPKAQGPGGVQVLAGLGLDSARGFKRSKTAPVLLFVWGTHVLPVFLTSVSIVEQAFLPSLVPYRAKATLQMQQIESDNPFYTIEKARQVVSSALCTVRSAAGALGGLF